MKSNSSRFFWQALGLGVLAGMRTSSAPVIASYMLSRNPSKNMEKGPLRFMQSKTVANGLLLMSVSELIVDKLPSTPNRIEPGGVMFRSLSGALAGASISKAAGGKAANGAVLGAAAAFASTFGSFYLRKYVVEKTKIFDPVIGAIEDALVIGGCACLARIG